MLLHRINFHTSAQAGIPRRIIFLIRLLFFSSFLLIAIYVSGQAPAGSLVIVGGGLDEHNDEVFQEMIRLAGGKEKAVFAVIPSAGGAPVQSFVYFRSELAAYGIPPSRVHLVPVAMVDDDSTKEVNEAEWRFNGRDEKWAGLIRKCSAVWFTGGDQLRTVRTLCDSLGKETPVLRAVWEVYRSGGMVGGTSAGAAIMSDTMICGGTAVAALTRGVIRKYDGDDFPEDSGVLVLRGLGFFPHGVVDQHFNQRSRIGRLAMVLMDIRQGKQPGSTRMPGFGIDENTALVYSAATDKMMVLGSGGVTILDPGPATRTRSKGLTEIRNLQLRYLESGDAFDFRTGTLTPAPGKEPFAGKERFSEPFIDHSGMLSQNLCPFRDLYARYLMDHTSNRAVETVTMTGPDEGILFKIEKSPESLAFRSGDPHKGFRYTLSGITLSLIPVKMTTVPLLK